MMKRASTLLDLWRLPSVSYSYCKFCFNSLKLSLSILPQYVLYIIVQPINKGIISDRYGRFVPENQGMLVILQSPLPEWWPHRRSLISMEPRRKHTNTITIVAKITNWFKKYQFKIGSVNINKCTPINISIKTNNHRSWFVALTLSK